MTSHAMNLGLAEIFLRYLTDISAMCNSTYLCLASTGSAFLMEASVVTKALDAETKTEAAGFVTKAKTEAVASETEAITEAVYLKTEAEAQGSWPILLTVLSSIQLRKIKLNHRYMMFTCNAAVVHSRRS